MKPTDLARPILSDEQLDAMVEDSKNDRAMFVGSEIRMLVHDINLARGENERLEAENARLRAALKRYGQHLPSCATALNTYRRNGPPKKCDCGWSALTPPKEPKP